MRRDCAGKVDAVEVSNDAQISPPGCVVAGASKGHGKSLAPTAAPHGLIMLRENRFFRHSKASFVADVL